MNSLSALPILAAVLVFAPATAGAQAAQKKVDVPASHKPPAGLCRIWVDGVPPAKQPAPTECATALRNKPANGTVIFGEPKPAAAQRTGVTLPSLSALRRGVVPPPATGRRVQPVDTAHRAGDTTRTAGDTTRGRGDTVRVRRDTTGG